MPLDKPVVSAEHTLSADPARAAARTVRHDLVAADRRDAFVTGAWLSGAVAGLTLAFAGQALSR
ncbi:hypothetical protein [Catenulispora subtropica]|uniref:Uncharacterized protein n=1 Tax=Catenulispora subtropica TaxID=450798 RepID=A0ABP5E3Y7_9ACTN